MRSGGSFQVVMMKAPYLPTERRPIAARQWGIWQRVSLWLARRSVSPNGISLAGMTCGIAAGASLAMTVETNDYRPVAWLLAAVLIQLRLLANLLDGMVAIESGRASPVGELFNDVPDRVSDTAILIGAGYAVGGQVELGYAAACIALFTAYIRTLGKATGAQQEYCGPMAKQQRMAVVTAIALYCGLAPESLQPTWQGWGLIAAGLCVIVVGGLLTAGRRLGRITANLRRTGR